MKKVLFVCTGNIDRSRTAQEMFSASEEIEAKSAGISPDAPIRLSRELVNWADIVFVMENKHQKAVLRLNPRASGKVVCLDIPDIYTHGEPKLKQLLAQKLRPYSRTMSLSS